MNTKTSLVIFDPLSDGALLRSHMENYLAEGPQKSKWQAIVKRGLHTMRNNLYQIVYIQPGIMSPQERLNSRNFAPGTTSMQMPSFTTSYSVDL